MQFESELQKTDSVGFVQMELLFQLDSFPFL
jgi:hypothetical protein